VSYPPLHDGLKAQVAPDRAEREAVPNITTRLLAAEKGIADSAESRFNESIRDATKKFYPWMRITGRFSRRKILAARQHLDKSRNSSKQSAVAVMRDNPKSASASRRGDAP